MFPGAVLTQLLKNFERGHGQSHMTSKIQLNTKPKDAGSIINMLLQLLPIAVQRLQVDLLEK